MPVKGTYICNYTWPSFEHYALVKGRFLSQQLMYNIRLTYYLAFFLTKKIKAYINKVASGFKTTEESTKNTFDILGCIRSYS